MLRRVFTFLSAASLVLCVATVVLWVRTYWVADYYSSAWAVVRHEDPAALRRWGATAARGGLYVKVEAISHGGPPAEQRQLRELMAAEGAVWGQHEPAGYPAPLWDDDVAFSRWGLMWGPPPGPGGDGGQRGWWVTLPLWLIAGVLVLPSLGRAGLLLRRRWRSGRARHGRCPACGYDLRATPDRCPECGKAPTGPTTARDSPTGVDRRRPDPSPADAGRY